MLAWCDWLRWHTVDPCDVLLDGFIEIDPDLRQIRYLGTDYDENGKPRITAWWDVATVVRVVQLEAVPSSPPADVRYVWSECAIES